MREPRKLIKALSPMEVKNYRVYELDGEALLRSEATPDWLREVLSAPPVDDEADPPS